MKVLKGILKVLVFIILLLIVFILVLGAMLFNNTDETPDYVQDVTSLESETSGLVELAIDDSEETNIVGLDMTLEDINIILAGVTQSLKAQNITYIKSIYMKNVDGVFVLYVPLTVKGISTLFSSSVDLSQANGQIILALDNISISKLRVTSFISKTVLPLLVTEEQLESSFSEIGITADINFEKMSIALNKSDVMLLLSNQMSSNYKALLDPIYSVVNREDLLNVGIHDETFGISVDVTKAKSDVTRMGTNSNALDVSSATNLVKYMLNNSDFATNNCNLLMKYLVYGYDTLTSDEQTIVNSWDLSIIGITDKTTYTAIKQPKDADITSSLLAQIALTDLISVLAGSSYGLKIEESTMNDILYNLDSVGTTISFVRYNHITKEYDVATICISGLWMEIVDDKAYFNLTIDVNGCELGLTLDLSNPTSTLLTLNNKVSAATLGSIDLNEEEIKGLLSFLSTETASIEWMSIDAENASINFNFAKLMPQSSILQQIATFYTNRQISYVGKSIDEEGYIQITYLK